ncbi:hypothetical protein FGW20_12565 [Methanoculleus sp. FWC-SCC3]|uniref:RING-type domain-containing protein n=1 Tax=Methanoculleus methanifontis TaxID=2584086 RepID=A0ABT8M5F6_9EURY|nr:hypothetical protein [Methanoculleus sp. FWC-SCC3]MDN7013843.1 hypothetical protein [Methanoculleus sp. FWC-SCC3]
MHESDVTRKTTSPSCDTDDAEDDGPAPCPFCGCQSHIEDLIAVNPRTHTIHQCLWCGRWFDKQGPACPKCRSSSEYLGCVDALGCDMYAQYRCRRCGHGFMLKIRENTDNQAI